MINKRNLNRENLDVAKKRKPYERNGILSDSSTKHRHKKFKFDYANKWYMHTLESVMKNETHKLLWNFEIQTDHLISARQLVLVIINKKENLPNNGV